MNRLEHSQQVPSEDLLDVRRRAAAVEQGLRESGQPGGQFSRLVEAVAPTAVVVAGGKYSSPPDALQMAYNSVQAGAVGVDLGRNIFQADNPVGMIKAIGSIVHENHTVKEALDIYSACLHGASRLD